MSTGKLCGVKIKISERINGSNDIVVSCDQYEGHEGDHSKMFYHCVPQEDSKIFKTNHRVGEIKWNNELSES